MGGHSELRLQVLGQERVEAGDGQQVQHRRCCAEHQDVVAELTFDRLREVLEARLRFLDVLFEFLGIFDGAHFDWRWNAIAAQMPRKCKHGDGRDDHEGGDDDEA